MICVPRTPFFHWHMWRSFSTHDSYIYIQIHAYTCIHIYSNSLCHTYHWYVWHDLLKCMTWVTCVTVWNESHAWQESCLNMLKSWLHVWPIDMCDRAHWCVNWNLSCMWDDWQDWGLTLEALPPRGGGSAGCPKKDKRRARGGSGDQNAQIYLNK